jgi:hypothetical protein
MRSDNPSWFSWPFARLWNRSAPNADRPVYVIGPDTSQPQPTNIDLAIVPRGTGALVAQVPDGTSVGGNKRGENAVDWQTRRGNPATQVASGPFCVIGGGRENTASGDTAGVGCGFFNSATGSQSVVAGGYNCNATNTTAAVCGGNTNAASGNSSFVGGGSFNTASSSNSAICGGQFNVADGANSAIPGGLYATARGLSGRFCYSSGALAATAGDAQYALMLLRRITTDSTPTAITSTNTAASSINIPALPNTSLYAFRGQVACIQTAGTAGTVGDCKTWDIVGSIKRGAAAANTALLGTPTITVLGADTNLGADNTTGAIIAITADTTNGGLLITVTGQTDKTLRWVATVHTTEVDY